MSAPYYALVYVKKGTGGLNVHDEPNGKIIDAIEPQGVHIQTVGTPMIRRRGIEWVEITYSRPRSKPERGWVAEHCVDIQWQTSQKTVHEHQTEYEEAVKFPRNSTDIPVPEPSPSYIKIIGWLALALIAVWVIVLWVT